MNNELHKLEHAFDKRNYRLDRELWAIPYDIVPNEVGEVITSMHNMINNLDKRLRVLHKERKNG